MNLFKNPFSFIGRIRRTEYIISWVLYLFILSLISEFQNQLIEKNVELSIFFVTFILYIPLLWFNLAQNTKRCHDRGNSGIYQFIPFYMLWLIFGEGEKESNEYGENPRENRELNHKVNLYNNNMKGYFSKFLEKIKKYEIYQKIKTLKLNSDEIIIISVVLGVIVALLFGSVFGETKYFMNNGERASLKYHNFSEFHFSYISSISSFIITTGLSYILLNRKNGEKL